MISEIIKDRAKLVNETIEELLKEQEPEGLYRAARHYLKAGGKRLRPVITLLSAEALGEDYRKAVHAAIAIETVHNFTLVHDDIMDEDEMRRGVKTVHTLFGIPTAILAGDTLYAEAFEILSMSDAPPENIVRAVSKLARVCVEICEGQFMDMSFEERDSVGESEYLEMVRKKTGVLIGISASIPAVLFGKDESVEKALWNYGIYSGIGFQIHDDLLDISGKGKIGKDWGSDILEGKKTLIVIKAFEEGIELETFGKGRASEEELERDIKKLFDCGAVDYARERAREYIEMAKKNLEVIDESPARNYLVELADYLIERDH